MFLYYTFWSHSFPLPIPLFFWHTCSRHAWWTWDLLLLLFGLSIHAGSAAQIIEGKTSPNYVYKLRVRVNFKICFPNMERDSTFQIFIFSAAYCSSFHIGKLLQVKSLNCHSFWKRENKYIGSPAVR